MLEEAPSPLRAQPRAELTHAAPAQACALLFCYSVLGQAQGREQEQGQPEQPRRLTMTPEGCWQLALLLCIPASWLLHPTESRISSSSLCSLHHRRNGGKQEAIGLLYSAHAWGWLSSGWLLLPLEHRSSSCQCQEAEGAQDPAQQERPAPPSALAGGTGQLPRCGVGAQGSRDPLLPPQSYPQP